MPFAFIYYNYIYIYDLYCCIVRHSNENVSVFAQLKGSFFRCQVRLCVSIRIIQYYNNITLLRGRDVFDYFARDLHPPSDDDDGEQFSIVLFRSRFNMQQSCRTRGKVGVYRCNWRRQVHVVWFKRPLFNLFKTTYCYR